MMRQHIYLHAFLAIFLGVVINTANGNVHKTCALFLTSTFPNERPGQSSSSCTSSLSSQQRQQAPLKNNNNEFKPLGPNPNLIRGERYNDANSTIPSPAEIARKLNVQPTKEASAKTWKRAWKMHKRSLPLLHSMDSCRPADSSLNLACMWWKALAGNDPSSPVYDDGLAYDVLPSGFRRIVKWPLRKLYPRLHHANVELRTAFLDNAIHEIITHDMNVNMNMNNNDSDNNDGNDTTSTSNNGEKKQIKVQLICMGAGYDLRGVKMLERGWVDKVIELDLPEVVKAKERLFERLVKRRPQLQLLDSAIATAATASDGGTIRMPSLIPADFNDIEDVKEKLRGAIIDIKDENEECEWYTIFVFEGVMIYLNEGIPSSLLNVTSGVLHEKQMGGSLALADRLENVPGGDYDLGVAELERGGWNVQDWKPKPGLARHMLKAHLIQQQTV